MDLATTDRKVQAAIGLGFIVAAVAMAGQTFLVDAEAGYAGIGPRFFPFAIAAGLGLCGLGLILEALTGGYRNLEGAPSGMKLDRAARQGLGWTSATDPATVGIPGAPTSGGRIPRRRWRQCTGESSAYRPKVTANASALRVHVSMP